MCSNMSCLFEWRREDTSHLRMTMPLPPYEGARLLTWVFSHDVAEDCGLSITETSSTNTCCAALGVAIKRSACEYANQTVTPTGDEVCASGRRIHRHRQRHKYMRYAYVLTRATGGRVTLEATTLGSLVTV